MHRQWPIVDTDGQIQTHIHPHTCTCTNAHTPHTHTHTTHTQKLTWDACSQICSTASRCNRLLLLIWCSLTSTLPERSYEHDKNNWYSACTNLLMTYNQRKVLSIGGSQIKSLLWWTVDTGSSFIAKPSEDHLQYYMWGRVWWMAFTQSLSLCVDHTCNVPTWRDNPA